MLLNVSGLKSLYTKLPGPARAMFGFIPPPYRFSPSYYLWTSRLKRASSPDVVRKFRETRLRQVLRLNLEYVDFYKPLARDCHLRKLVENDPFGALNEFPVINREMLVADISRFLPQKSIFGGAHVATTGGTSGAPVKLHLSNSSWGAEWAFVFQYLSRFGVGDTDRRISLRGVRFGASTSPVELNATYRELRISPFHLDASTIDRIAESIIKFNATYIHGYPSSIGLLVDLLGDQAATVLKGVKLMLCVSEDVRPGFLGHMARLLPNINIASFYGLSERVAFIERLDDGSWVPNELYGVTELMNERIVATGFLNLALPLVRYDTGDYVDLSGDSIYSIRGRWKHASLITRDGGRVSMTALNLHSENFGEIGEFQLVQEIPGIVDILYLPFGKSRDRAVERVAGEFSSKCEGQIIFRGKSVNSLILSGIGKRPLVINRVQASGSGF